VWLLGANVTVSIADVQIFFLMFVRVLAITMVTPMLSTRRYPAQVKIGLAFFLTLILFPMQPKPDQPWQALAYGLAVSRELLTGLLAGFASLITFAGLQMGATFIGMQSGTRMANMLNPKLSDIVQVQGSALEQLYTVVVALLFLLVGGHHLVILGIQKTFQMMPAGQFTQSPLAIYRLMELTGMMFNTAVFIAMPVMGTQLLVSLALAIISRVVPEVPVIFLGAPLKVGLGAITLLLALPWMTSFIIDNLSRVIDDMLIFVAS